MRVFLGLLLFTITFTLGGAFGYMLAESHHSSSKTKIIITDRAATPSSLNVETPDISEIESLHNEIIMLQEELDELEHTTSSSKEIAKTAAVIAPPPSPSVSPKPSHQASRFERAMRDMGIEREDAEAFKQRFDEYHMQDLLLEDQARREGWQNTQQLNDARRKNLISLRQDLGDDNFDKTLYAMGRPNRLRISDVIHGSPGKSIGLQSGDLILAYEGTNIYSAQDLRYLIDQGTSGESVVMDIQRGDVFLQFFLERGPIGINLSHRRVKPSDD